MTGVYRYPLNTYNSLTLKDSLEMLTLKDTRIGVVGLGYVGLPLAVTFGRELPTTGFDIDEARIAELEAGRDSTC